MLDQKIIFRADGSPAIGYGHVYRMIALLKMLYKYFDCVFASDDCPVFLQDELQLLNVPFIQLNNIDYPLPDSRKQGEEVPFDMDDVLKGNEIVVLDGYWFGSSFQRKIKEKGCKLVNIDDLHETIFYSDLIINHAPGASSDQYEAQAYTEYALGLSYVLLRPAFLKMASEKRSAKKEISNLLICFGGSDFLNLSATAVTTAQRFHQFKKITVVTGAGYQHVSQINEMGAKDQRVIHLHAIGENEMAAQFATADVCVVPSSGVLLEALASGSIIISGCYAANQKSFYESFLNRGLIEGVEAFTEKKLTAAFEKVLSTGRKEYPAVIDGQSPGRIKNKFLHIASAFRKAEKDDTVLLFNWANDNDVRQNAVNKQPVQWDGHVAWFNNKLQSPSSNIFILELNDQAVGQVRLDEENGSWWIDYSIDKKFRGYGLGTVILEKALRTVKGKKIDAIVKEGNEASAKVFQKLGFVQMGNREVNSENYNHFEIQL